MKKLFSVLAIALALNFLAVAGGVGWLYQSGHLDRAKLKQVRELLFAPPPVPAPTTQPSENVNETPPVLSLDQLMAKESGRPVSEQIDFIRKSFDAQMLQLDQRQRVLADLQRQVDLANQKMASDRAELDKQTKLLAQREQEADRLETDKGFQDSLALYESMPSKQVKTIFLTLSDRTVMQYLQAMPPKSASKVIKEFKSPEETVFIQRVLEKMRQSPDSPTPSQGQDAGSTAQMAGASGKQP